MEPIAHLGWLPPAPEDFAARAKALKAAEGDLSAELRALAGYRLDANQLQRLARIVEAARGREEVLAGMMPLKLGIISNATTDFVSPAIIGSGLRHGLAIEVVAGPYGQCMQEALDPGSMVNRAGCDVVLLAIDSRGYPLHSAPGDRDAGEAAIATALGQVEAMRAGLAAYCPTVIVQSLPALPETLLGSYDALLAGSETQAVAAFNTGLAERASSGMLLLDVAGLAARTGLDRWHDPAAWNVAKQPFAHSLIPAYAEHLARLLGALKGKSRKVLVLDLDNTVWSGVIGDDGLDGINIAQGDPVGEAHLALQAFALSLRDRGVVLAVSSKNTDEIARQVFREHPDMLLREEHIAVFQANWTDKASNLGGIAEALNLGLDSLVFVDDNPAERELIRQRLPQVAVPELPDSSAFYVRTVAAAGYFEAAGFSDEDRARSKFYEQNAKRVAVQAAAGGIDDYLASLAMTIRFAPFDERGRARIAQLINKSNQFNLTTRRYTEGEVAALGDDPAVVALQIRLEDVFGDNGMISTVIARVRGEEAEIDTWLMSCRVLGRRVEEAALAELARLLRARGVTRLIGIFRPSERNGIVVDHYRKLGFTLDSTDAAGEARWELDIASADFDFPDIFAHVLREDTYSQEAKA